MHLHHGTEVAINIIVIKTKIQDATVTPYETIGYVYEAGGSLPRYRNISGTEYVQSLAADTPEGAIGYLFREMEHLAGALRLTFVRPRYTNVRTVDQEPYTDPYAEGAE